MLARHPQLPLLTADTAEHGIDLAREYRPDLIGLGFSLTGV